MGTLGSCREPSVQISVGMRAERKAPATLMYSHQSYRRWGRQKKNFVVGGVIMFGTSRSAPRLLLSVLCIEPPVAFITLSERAIASTCRRHRLSGPKRAALFDGIPVRIMRHSSSRLLDTWSHTHHHRPSRQGGAVLFLPSRSSIPSCIPHLGSHRSTRPTIPPVAVAFSSSPL